MKSVTKIALNPNLESELRCLRPDIFGMFRTLVMKRLIGVAPSVKVLLAHFNLSSGSKQSDCLIELLFVKCFTKIASRRNIFRHIRVLTIS